MENAQWLEERRKGIGGSDVAAIMGMSPWKTPYQVYQEKRREVQDWSGNEATDWGKRMEPAIRQWYSDTTGRAVRLPEGILVHNKYPFMLATLDGFTDDRRVVEIKTARSPKGWGDPGTNEIPDYYLLQVQHYLVVTGFEVCDVPVSIGGASPELYEVPEDQELQEMIIDACASFWVRVQNENPPDPVTYSDAVQRFGKVPATGLVFATESDIVIINDLVAVQKQISALKESEEDLKGQIIAALGDKGDVLAGPDEKALVTYKLANGRKMLDAKALEREMPEIYQKYLKTSEPSRRFLLKA